MGPTGVYGNSGHDPRLAAAHRWIALSIVAALVFGVVALLPRVPRDQKIIILSSAVALVYSAIAAYRMLVRPWHTGSARRTLAVALALFPTVPLIGVVVSADRPAAVSAALCCALFVALNYLGLLLIMRAKVRSAPPPAGGADLS